MTRRPSTLAAPRDPDKLAMLRPLRPQRNLTEEVVARITEEIRKGRLGPGARLPTEQELMKAMGVSRTVVREAVAALRAEGMVTTRQGSGAFVATDASRVPFRIDPDGLSSIGDVLEVMELRLALEIEAAALAAERITPDRLVKIGRALGDIAFHLAIAEASRNPRFAQLLEFLGRHVIPRQSVRVSIGTPQSQRQYLVGIQKEHGRIYEAIRDGQPADARKAMRTHLTRSLQRYRGLAERHLDVK
jgi:GntR family transcriptional repressor for pyruvate dehydrogenase complex